MSVLPRASNLTPTSSRSFHTWGRRIRNSEVYRHGYKVVANRTDVRFWHKADMPITLSNVRFRGQSGHSPFTIAAGRLDPRDNDDAMSVQDTTASGGISG